MLINTNMSSIMLNNALEKTNNKVQKNNLKLSTGRRINNAADDSAGMAIVNKLHTQIRGLKMASRNSLDGISLIQTAESALNEQQNMLQRIRALSLQAANDTLDYTDRESIQKEVNQLLTEIDSVSNVTEFNRVNLLNGDASRLSYTNSSSIAKCIYSSDTFEPGSYKFEVKKSGTSAKLAGSAVNFPKPMGSTQQGLNGSLEINGEKVRISANDTSTDIKQNK